MKQSILKTVTVRTNTIFVNLRSMMENYRADAASLPRRPSLNPPDCPREPSFFAGISLGISQVRS
jgi:hypothetical protein